MAANQKGAGDKATVSVPEFDGKLVYTVVGTGSGKGKHLLKGIEYTVSGADAASIIQGGHAVLKQTDK